jgi:cytochrome c oxidase subunit 2
MGLVLLVVIWLITFISAYFFIAKTWWLPAGASVAAAGIDHHFSTTYILMGAVFVAAQVILGYFAWQYRDRGSASRQAQYSHGNNTLEITWTVLTLILFVGLNFMSSSIWASERFRPAAPGAVQVEVTAMQFAWYFRYPGADGKFGATKPELQDASAGGEGAIGLDTTDPASKDDVVAGTMYVPVNREVDVTLRAADVIHSFFSPAMRFKQDAVPGIAIHMHFTPITVGDYEIACSQLCGLGHYKMRGILKVVNQEDYDKWLAAREAEKQ